LVLWPLGGSRQVETGSFAPHDEEIAGDPLRLLGPGVGGRRRNRPRVPGACYASLVGPGRDESGLAGAAGPFGLTRWTPTFILARFIEKVLN
jgi:hypothetical protein